MAAVLGAELHLPGKAVSCPSVLNFRQFLKSPLFFRKQFQSLSKWFSIDLVAKVSHKVLKENYLLGCWCVVNLPDVPGVKVVYRFTMKEQAAMPASLSCASECTGKEADSSVLLIWCKLTLIRRTKITPVDWKVGSSFIAGITVLSSCWRVKVCMF